MKNFKRLWNYFFSKGWRDENEVQLKAKKILHLLGEDHFKKEMRKYLIVSILILGLVVIGGMLIYHQNLAEEVQGLLMR